MTVQRTTKQQILDAIHDLHNAEQMVTREALQELTGLKLTIIDDRTAILVDEGLVLRKGRGVFLPAVQHKPARPISKTAMPDGTVKIEIGDVVLELTPREDRLLASIQTGVALQIASIEMGQEVSATMSAMRTRMSRMEAQLRAQEEGRVGSDGA